jgi:hypothetical protein
MRGQAMGIVIRTVFNNQGWAGPCKNPLKDYRCFKCVEGGGLNINEGKSIDEDERGFCKGVSMGDPKLGERWCWEQTLCTKFFWRNVIGKWRYAIVEMPVYFVYSEFDGSLTLWGHSVIDRIENEYEYPTLYFRPFKPLPQDKWVKGLRGRELTGEHWKQLHYRYLDEKHEAYLNSLIQGKERLESTKSPILSSKDYETLNFQLRRDIKEKLEKIANNEGREIEDVIREAVAKIIRNRGF